MLGDESQVRSGRVYLSQGGGLQKTCTEQSTATLRVLGIAHDPRAADFKKSSQQSTAILLFLYFLGISGLGFVQSSPQIVYISRGDGHDRSAWVFGIVM